LIPIAIDGSAGWGLLILDEVQTGHPLFCSAGIAAINVLLEERLADQAAAKGQWMLKQHAGLQKTYPEILKDAHGKGLLIGLEFVDRFIGYRVAAGLFKLGMLVAGTLLSARTIRIEPALNIDKDLLEKVLDRLDDTLNNIQECLEKEPPQTSRVERAA